jgi:hypothetical protein
MPVASASETLFAVLFVRTVTSMFENGKCKGFWHGAMPKAVFWHVHVALPSNAQASHH